jgi:hypothetical protein
VLRSLKHPPIATATAAQRPAANGRLAVHHAKIIRRLLVRERIALM